MKRILCSLAALAFCVPLLARAAEGWVVDDVSLKAGPDLDYPSIAELDAGTPVSIQGCVDDWTWCDVISYDDRGWVPATFLEEEYQGRPVVLIDYGPRIGIPVVSFSLGTYWERHYHDRPFFSERHRFESREARHGSPPRPARVVANAPRPEAKPKPVSGTAATPSGTQGTAAGTATVQQQQRTSTQGTSTQTTTPQQRATSEQRTAGQTSAPTATAGTTQSAATQRDRDRQRTQQSTQTARSGQPSSSSQPANEQQRSAQTRRSETQPAPGGAAPQMVPERPTAQRPAPQERPTQMARASSRTEHANERTRANQQGPKSKDELRKPKPQSDDKDKKKDNTDNGGG